MNSNCLEGKACPKCGYEDEVLVHASMWVSLMDSGTDVYADSVGMCGGAEYDSYSGASCPKCGYEGNLGDWNKPAAK